MKTILLILALSGSLSAEVGVSLYTNGITKSASDARYVLRNPYYDGSQSVTVASATVGSTPVSGKEVPYGFVGNLIGVYSPTADNGIQFGRSDIITGGGDIWWDTSGEDLYLDNHVNSATADIIFRSKTVGNGSLTSTNMRIAGDGAITMPLGSFSVGTSTLVVKEGKVGIGGIPMHPLQANYIGATAGSISVNNVLQLQSDKTDSNTGVGIRFSNSTDLAAASANAIISGVRTNASGSNSGALAFFTNTDGTNVTEKLRINHIGNVGIGTTAPDTKLHISTGVLTIDGSTTGDSIKVIGTIRATNDIYAGGTDFGSTQDGAVYVKDYTNATKALISASAVSYFTGGNVGIGATAPDQKLTVAGNISTTGQIISSGTGSNYFAGTIRHTTTGSYLNNNSVCAAGSGNVPICMFGSGSNGSISTRLSNFPLLLGTFNNTDILTLGIAGSDMGANFKGPVGISSSAPAAQLGVTGGIIATSSVTAQGGLYSPTTAINYFAGNVGIGTTAPTSKVSVSSSTASTAFMGLNGAATKAEILAFDPVKAGEMFFCTDCVASTVCISTGTAVADFADIGDRTVACN